MTTGDASAAYEARRVQHTVASVRLERQAFWISLLRLATVIVLFIVLWLSIQSRTLPLWSALVPGALFVFLLAVHERVLRRAALAKSGAELYRQALRRLAGEWLDDGELGERFAEQADEHLYAADLDLFGRGSLFQLLCRASSATGQRVLAHWLLAPADAEEARARQRAVEELAPQLDVRERLAVLGTQTGPSVDSAELLDWARRSPVLRSHMPARIAAGLLAVGNVAAVVAWWPLGYGPTALLVLGIIELVAFLILRHRLAALGAGVERSARQLEQLSEALQLLESASWQARWLADRRSRLGKRGPDDESEPASQAIVDLRRLVELGDSMRNPLFVPFGLLLLWGVQTGLAIDAWRLRYGHLIEGWLETLGELEALSSIAWFAFENPDYTQPEIRDEGDQPQLIAEGLGHPLLPRESCQLNDVALGLGPDCEAQAFVISGSNMSGKSTFLRSCGINTALALAGAPVRARRLRLTPLAIGASIRIQDSLQEGSSKFYAEITRLRAILDLAAGERPTLFLLDEILHGTNSHDRRIGAEAAVHALLQRRAIGLVTTHDLALANMASERSEPSKAAESPAGKNSHSVDAATSPPPLINKHFVDHLEGGRIHFDYKLRPGVVQRSNALALMREVGLDV